MLQKKEYQQQQSYQQHLQKLMLQKKELPATTKLHKEVRYHNTYKN